MVTEFDENKGLVKTYWANVRKRVAKVEPTFAKIVDELNPDKSFPLYLAYYPYGAVDADTQSTFFPKIPSGYYRLTDPDAPKDVLKHLGYSANNTPLGMVLDKQFESYIDLKNKGITIPCFIYTPGKMFPFTRILKNTNNRIYSPNGLLSSTAGARSCFMLPNVGCTTSHANLQRDFNVKSFAPKTLYEHWNIFKEIINTTQCEWHSCVMYFSEKWINKIFEDKAWNDLAQHLRKTAWHQFEFEINRIHYDIIFSLIQQKRNLKPNPYLVDTAKHLLTTALGAAPGYIPATDESALPLKTLQKAFSESYGLKKYLPTIIQPSYFSFEEDTLPIYYSLQNPATHVFSPKSSEGSSTLRELRELEHIMKIFMEELAKNDSFCAGTIVEQIAKNIKFSYFHNKIDNHRVVRPSIEIPNYDERFKPTSLQTNVKFASDAPFVRGCISISVKHQS